MQLSAPAAAADTVYFTAINENVLELTDATMPFWSGGYLYMPSSVVDKLDLGLSPNLLKGKLILYAMKDRGQYLIFDITNGTVTDGQNNGYYPGAVQRNGAVFLPVSVVAKFFALSYSNIQVNHGYLVWVRDGRMSLTDAQFADAATYNLENRYSNYTKSRTPAAEVPTSPPQTPDVTSNGQYVYLCVAAPETAAAESLLEELSRYGSQATFYFTPEQMEGNDDLLRRMAATGQAVGILADAGRTDLTVLEQIALGNAHLSRAVCGKTRLVQLKNAKETTAAQVTAEGYCLLTPGMDREKYGLQSAAAATTLLGRVTTRRGPVSVWLGDEVNAVALRAFLAAARSADNRCLALTETA